MEIYQIILFFGVIFGLVFAIKFVESTFRDAKYESGDNHSLSSYRVRERVMNDSEATFFLMLEKELPKNHFVFPKMRIADIFETKDGQGYYSKRNKILPKHIDFLVCDSRFRPIIAIELDGKSHNSYDRIVRDEFVNRLFSSSHLELMRVRVGTDFRSIIQEVVQKCKD